MSKWKPIDTAPEGKILVALPGGAMLIGTKMGDGIWSGYYSNRVTNATHWMHLPKPPKERK